MQSKNWKRSFFFGSSLVIGMPVAFLSATGAQAEDSFVISTQTEQLTPYIFADVNQGNSFRSMRVEDVDSFSTVQHHCKLLKTAGGWYCIPLPHPKR